MGRARDEEIHGKRDEPARGLFFDCEFCIRPDDDRYRGPLGRRRAPPLLHYPRWPSQVRPRCDSGSRREAQARGEAMSELGVWSPWKDSDRPVWWVILTAGCAYGALWFAAPLFR
jgi:hypothetical protein